MEVNEAIKTRRSVRSYLPRPVPKKVLEEIVEVSQWAASPGNMQPWYFAIVGGKKMVEFQDCLYQQVENEVKKEIEFETPDKVPELYDKRRSDYRVYQNSRLYPPGTEDVEAKKRAYYLSGARLFDAPNAIIVCTDKRFIEVPWGLVALGMIMENLCLAAVDRGLGTCVMGRPVDWPDMLRRMFDIPSDMVPLNGIAIGYPNPEAPVNNFLRVRIPLESWVHWHGF